MKGWFRLAIALSAFWVFGCGVVLLIEISRLPAGRDCTPDKPSFEAFFRGTKISAVHVRHPQLGIVAFPETMSRPEIEDALRRLLPRYYQPTNALVEWDVAVDKPEDYYSIAFDRHRLLRIAIFPAVAIFVAVLVVACGTRWVFQGFKTRRKVRGQVSGFWISGWNGGCSFDRLARVMARPLRIERPGGWYHITVRGNERRDIFRDDRDREHWCELVGDGSGRFGVVVHAYVLMSNHYHLLMETPQANLSQTMQWLNVSYSVWFNRRHRRVGHLFQGRYKGIVVEPDAWGLELSRYVHLNPVRVGELGLDKESRRRQRLGADEKPDAGEVRERIERLRAYRWSSYRAYVCLTRGPGWLQVNTVLKGIGNGSLAERRKAYRQYVETAVREGLRESPWEALEAQMVLGTKSFLERICRGVRGDEKEQPALKWLPNRPRWKDVVAVVEAIKGQKWEEFRNRHGDWGRDLALYLGRKYGGLKLKELAHQVGGLDYRTVSWAVDRFGKRAAKEKELGAVLAAGQKKIQNPET